MGERRLGGGGVDETRKGRDDQSLFDFMANLLQS